MRSRVRRSAEQTEWVRAWWQYQAETEETQGEVPTRLSDLRSDVMNGLDEYELGEYSPGELADVQTLWQWKGR